jgi:hypothetical protein
MAFAYYSPISVNAAQVPSTQTDFPMLVSVTDARFKTVANSGHVQNSSGFDIRPYTDSTLTTAITGYELERYNASTGEVIIWVKISSLSSSTTPFVLAYGDSGISTDGSSTTTWSNSFVDVYHFKDGTTLNVNSSAPSGHNGTNNNGVTAAAGQIDGCGSFVSASTQNITTSAYSGTAAITYSAWVNATSFPNAYNAVCGFVSTPNFVILEVKSNGKVGWFVSNTGVTQDGTGSHTLSSATWYHLVMTYDATSGLVGYVNGASDVTHAANGQAPQPSVAFTIGIDQGTAGRNWNGKIDEVRRASVVRSADWVATEYNNQSAPGTFATLGTEASFVGAIRNSNWLLFFT